MIIIGSKTLLVSGITSVMLLIAIITPYVGVEWARNFTPEVLFIIGLFTSLVSTSIYSFWHLGRQSQTRFGAIKDGVVPENHQILFSYKEYKFIRGPRDELVSNDFHPSVIFAMILISVFLLCMLTINNRAYQLLANFEDLLKPPASHYCQDKEDKKEEDTSVKQGCDLIMKAWEMGYVKDLGECAPDEDEVSLTKICEKRQKDEPWMHYSYRKLVSAFQYLRLYIGDDMIFRERTKFDQQREKWETLVYAQQAALESRPRSAHHIWTNHSYEDSPWRKFLKSMGGGDTCLQEWNMMKPVLRVEPDDDEASAEIFKHSLGHLLFNSSHNRGVGFCVEYKIHWNAPMDVCDRLLTDADSIFREYKIQENINSVIKSYENQKEIKELNKGLERFMPKSSKEIKEEMMATSFSLDPDFIKEAEEKKKEDEEEKKREMTFKDIMSFQCLFVGDERKADTRILKYRSHEIEVSSRSYQPKERETQSDDRFHPEPLKNLGRSFLTEFDYGAWMSREKPDKLPDESAIEQMLSDPRDFMFTRLDILKNTDIVLGSSWLKKRDDLLDVYPWYRHLHHYVEKYREVYMEKRGRL